MKEYSTFAKTVSVLTSITLSYFLIIFKFQYISESLSSIIENIKIWMFIEFGGSFLCLTVPILFSWYKFKFKLSYLLYGLPIVFILVLLYSPSGLYFIIPKGPFLITDPIINNWKYGIAISILFFIIQFITVSIAIITKEEKEKIKKQIKLQQDNLNHEKFETDEK